MSLLNILIPSSSADAVAVFDDSFNQVFEQANSMKVNVIETSKVMEHPVEDGTTITDHRVLMPDEIELSLILSGSNFRSVYQQIKQIYRAGTLLTVQTKTDTYSNMIISDMPHDESGDMFDAVLIAVRMKQVLFVTAQFGTLPQSKVANKSQSSTVKKGQQQSTAATPEQTARGSLLYRIFKRGQ